MGEHKKLHKKSIINRILLKKYLLEQNEDAHEKLIEINLPLVDYVVKKYINNDCDQKEFFSLATDGLLRAIEKFDINKIDSICFSTYAFFHIRNKIIKELESRKRKIPVVNFSEFDEENPIENLLQEEIYDEEDIMIGLDKYEESQLLDEAMSYLKPVDRKIIQMLYGLKNEEELTQIEIARKLGVTKSMISLRVHRSLNLIKTYLESPEVIKNHYRKNGRRKKYNKK